MTDYPVPGDFFGEKAVFAGTKDRQQIARTLTPARLTVFRPRELLDRLQQDRRFAIKFVRGLARRLDRLEEVISDFIAENAERRLVRVLLRLAPPVASSWVRLPFALTNIDFARTIGTTRARISQFLTRFQRLGWLRRHHQRLWIKREAFDQFLHSRTKPEADRQASHG